MPYPRILFLLLILRFLNPVYASHFLGADVGYRYLDGRRYEITITAYRDCRGISLGSIPLKVYNDSFEISRSPLRTSIKELKSANCPSDCNPQNTAAYIGTEAHEYRDTIDFNAGVYTRFGSPAYPRVYFATEACCRNDYILPGAGNFFAEAMLDLRYSDGAMQKTGFHPYYNPVQTYVNCGQTFNYSFRVPLMHKGDSLSYALVKAKEDKNTECAHSFYKKPFTHYCDNLNTQNCSANTLQNPVRGTSFDARYGNFMVTPLRCDELTVMVCRVDVYRPSGDSLVLAGYIKRDMQMAVLANNQNSTPYIVKNQHYRIKARETFCADIPLKDGSAPAQSGQDTLDVEVLKWPEYGILKLVDSLAREKTLRFCWNPADSDYIKSHKADLLFRVRERSCKPRQIYGLSTTVEFSVTAPDSNSSLLIKTFIDRNRNGRRDAGEKLMSAPVFELNDGIYKRLQTDARGELKYSRIKGLLRIGIPPQAACLPTGSDTILSALFDSLHTVELGWVPRSGISGRLYEDINRNCRYDSAEPLIPGQKLLGNGTSFSFSRDSGQYRIYLPAGWQRLSLHPESQYTVLCPDSLLWQVQADSLIAGKDIALLRKPGFRDLEVWLEPLRHIADNRRIEQSIRLRNRGFTTEKQIQVKLLLSRTPVNPGSNLPIYRSGDTLVWLADSIKPGAVQTILLRHQLPADSFKGGDRICYTLLIPSDSIARNNVFQLCETVQTDTGFYALKQSHNSGRILETDPGAVYSIGYRDAATLSGAVFITDTLDASVFDIRSLAWFDMSGLYRVDVAGNVLMAEIKADLPAGAFPRLMFALQYRSQVDSPLRVHNCMTALADAGQRAYRTCVSDSSASMLQNKGFSDSTLCKDAVFYVNLLALKKPDKGNRYRVFLSDSSGAFDNAVMLLDTLVESREARMSIYLPSGIPASTTYKVRVTGTAPACSGFDSEFGLPLEILEQRPPVLSSNLINGGVCLNDTLRLRAAGGKTYRFFYGIQALTPFTPDSIWAFVPQSAAFVSLQSRDEHGCIARSKKLNFVLHQLPALQLNLQPDKICSGDSVRISATGAQRYEVFLNDTFVYSNSGAGYTTPTLFRNTLVRVKGTDSNACVAEVQKQVSVLSLPFAPQVYQNGKALYSNYQSGNRWMDENGDIDSASGRYFYPPVNGTYRVRYTDVNGCSSVSEPYQFRYYGLDEAASPRLLILYPDPASDHLYIRHELPSGASYSVFDARGSLHLSGTLNAEIAELDIRALPAGVYSIRVGHEGRFYSRLFQVLR